MSPLRYVPKATSPSKLNNGFSRHAHHHCATFACRPRHPQANIEATVFNWSPCAKRSLTPPLHRRLPAILYYIICGCVPNSQEERQDDDNVPKRHDPKRAPRILQPLDPSPPFSPFLYVFRPDRRKEKKKKKGSIRRGNNNKPHPP